MDDPDLAEPNDREREDSAEGEENPEPHDPMEVIR